MNLPSPLCPASGSPYRRCTRYALTAVLLTLAPIAVRPAPARAQISLDSAKALLAEGDRWAARGSEGFVNARYYYWKSIQLMREIAPLFVQMDSRSVFEFSWLQGAAHVQIANIYMEIIQPDSALMFYHQTRQIWDLLMAGYPAIWNQVTDLSPKAKILINIANAHLLASRPDSAEINYAGAYEFWETVGGPDGDDGMRAALAGRASALNMQGLTDRADIYCRRAFDLWQWTESVGTYAWFNSEMCRVSW